MSTVVLDKVDNLIVDFSSFPIGNLHALEYLPRGMHLLADSVRRQEIALRQQPGGEHLVLCISPPFAELITNWFGWFSISLVSYLRLIRLLALMAEKGWTTNDLRNAANRNAIKSICTAYIMSVAPAIYRWRNKIAAHPAFTDPFVGDTIGTLELSIMVPVSFRAPYYRAGTIQWNTGGESSDLEEWALTQTFENLSQRFWPNVRLQSIPGL
jgi:hypothetical protein